MRIPALSRMWYRKYPTEIIWGPENVDLEWRLWGYQMRQRIGYPPVFSTEWKVIGTPPTYI